MILNNKNTPFDSYVVIFVDTRANKIEFDILNSERQKLASSFVIVSRTDVDLYEAAKTENIEEIAYQYLLELRGDDYVLETDLQNWADTSIVPSTKTIRTIMPESVTGDAAIDENQNMWMLYNEILRQSKLNDDPPVILRIKRSQTDVVNIIYTSTFPPENKSLMGNYLKEEIMSDGSVVVNNEFGQIIVEHKKI